MNRTHERRAGFTLIEILMVVAIVGVLAATSAEGLANWKRTAATQKAITDLQGLLVRASAQSIGLGLPYRITDDRSTRPRKVKGYLWSVESGRGDLDTLDRTVILSPLVSSVTFEPELDGRDGREWIFDAGGVLVKGPVRVRGISGEPGVLFKATLRGAGGTYALRILDSGDVVVGK